MRCHQPLLATHPELTLIERPGWVEYRIANSHLAWDGSGKVVKGYSGWSWVDALVSALLAVLWPKISEDMVFILISAGCLVLYLYHRMTQVLCENVIILPPHGIQLETHRGFSSSALFVSRRFISATSLRDVVINEGLRGWDVRFYLAALSNGDTGGIHLHVAYSNVLPHFPVLLEVYRGVQHVLFPKQF